MTPVKKQRQKDQADRIYLLHADELFYNQFGNNPGAQIVKGHVSFRHLGAFLSCDSAYYYQESNSVKAFGHVYFKQGDTLSLRCERATYDGTVEQMEARKNVVVHHRSQVLRTDSLNYDRLYNQIFFFDGGSLVDGHNRLVSDWGTYYPETRKLCFIIMFILEVPSISSLRIPYIMMSGRNWYMFLARNPGSVLERQLSEPLMLIITRVQTRLGCMGVQR
jgi:hypothetical protein